MSGRFLTDLDVRVVHDHDVRPWLRVLAPLHYESGLVGRIVVEEGFEFDGASIPRLGMLFVGWPGLRAACIHDWLLHLIERQRRSMAREHADLVFGEALDACGVPAHTAQMMTMAVQAYTAQLRQQMAGDIEPYGGA